ncbi:MAG: hypothetical protein ACREYF_11560, partial [Gammaproteobacteria bacterium]
LLIALATLPVNVSAEVECEGITTGGVSISGLCDDGDFEADNGFAYDAECEPGGEVTGYFDEYEYNYSYDESDRFQGECE